MSAINSNGTVIKQLSKNVPKTVKYYQRFKEKIINAYGTRLLILTIDILLVLFSFTLANLLRHNFNIGQLNVDLMPQTLVVVALVYIVAFRYFKTYSAVMRFTSEQDLMAVMKAIIASSTVMMLFTFKFEVFGEWVYFRKSIVAIDFLLSSFMLVAYRVALRAIHVQMNRERKAPEQVVIFGAGDCGHITKRTIDTDRGTHLAVKAFFDDDLSLHRKMMGGVPIYHTDNYFEEFVQRHQIKKAVIAIQKISPSRKEALVDLCLKHKITPLVVPPVENWLDEKLTVQSLRKINIEELLYRAPIKLDKQNIAGQIRKKVILVTGAAGSIGSEIVRQLVRFEPDQILLLDQAESPLVHLQLELEEKVGKGKTTPIVADIRDQQKIRKVFSEYRPEIVYHAAAYKHVPMMELNPEEAVKVNVMGVQVVANLAVRYGVSRFVMVSTDKAVNPTNIMGTTKRIAEMYCQSLNNFERNLKTRFITTRFGNVLGSNGSVVPRFKEQIEAGGPITVTHPDITRYFMTIPEACQLVLEAGAMGTGGEIFLFDMGKPVKIVDLARKMISLYGLEEGRHINIAFTGLRPGEKLYEELLNQAESTLKTHHEKITIANVRKENFNKVYKKINKLKDAIEAHNDMLLVANMKRMVPEFKSNCSRYAVLDEPEKLTEVLKLTGQKPLKLSQRVAS